MALAAAAGASPLGACDGGAAKEGGGGCGGAGTALALEPHKVVPAPFLTKTYQLVDDPATDSIVSWGDDLSTFVVWRPPEFARDVLPNYFKHNNFSSFVRQLNTYGFRKIVPERWEFANEFFRKGEKHLLCEIHRRKTHASSPLPLPNPHLHLPFHSHYHPHRAATAAVPASPYFVGSFPGEDVAYPAAWCDPSSPPGGAAAGSAASSTLVDENERLRRGNAALLAELARMRELYNDIIYFVQNHVRPVAPSSSFPSALLLAPPPSLHPSADKVPSAPLHKRLSGFHPWQQHQQQSNAKACLNWSSTTSSSSVTIAEAPSPNNNSSNINSNSAEDNCCEDDSNHSEGSGDGSARPKLFGVSLGASSSTNNKRSLHPQEPDVLPLQPAAKRHLHHPKEDLGLNLAPPSPS